MAGGLITSGSKMAPRPADRIVASTRRKLLLQPIEEGGVFLAVRQDNLRNQRKIGEQLRLCDHFGSGR